MTDRIQELEAQVKRLTEEKAAAEKKALEAKKQAARFENQVMNLKWKQNADADQKAASGGDSTRAIADLQTTIDRQIQEIKTLKEEREKAGAGVMSAKVTDELKATVERQEAEIKALKEAAGRSESGGEKDAKTIADLKATVERQEKEIGDLKQKSGGDDGGGSADEIADLKSAVESKQHVIKALQAEREESRQELEESEKKITALKAEIEALKKKSPSSALAQSEPLEELTEEPHPELEELGAHPNPTVDDIRELKDDLEPIDEVGQDDSDAPPGLISPPSESDRA